MDPRGPGKRYEKRVSNTQQALLGGAWVVLQERGSTYQTMVSRSPFSRGEGQGNFQDSRTIEEGTYISGQCHSAVQWGS